MIIHLLLGIIGISFVSAKVVHVSILTRHCDRAPFFHYAIPNDPIDWRKQLGLEYESLTAVGENQCFKVGQKLRSRYLTKDQPDFIKNIEPRFYNFDYRFQAGYMPRTIRTCFSISQGLFPLGTGSINDLTGECALPNCTQSVPIHTHDLNQDVILEAYQPCVCNPVLYGWMQDEIEDSAHWKDLDKNSYSRRVEFNRKLGFNSSAGLDNLNSWPIVFDIVNVQITHKLLNFTKLGLTEEDIDYMWWLHDAIRGYQFERQFIGSLGGGYYVREIVDNMRTYIDRKSDKSDYVKMSQYCAHDLTILMVLAAMDVSGEYKELQVNPKYGATLILELHQNDTSPTESFVKFVYLPVFDGNFTEYEIPGCGGVNCSFDVFEKLMLDRNDMSDWCVRCENHDVTFCKDKDREFWEWQTKFSWIVIAVLCVAVVLFFVIACVALCLFVRGEKKRHGGYERIQVVD